MLKYIRYFYLINKLIVLYIMKVVGIIFSEDKKSLNFCFEDGKVSPSYNSSETALKAFIDFYLKKQIDNVDYFRIREEIFSAKEISATEQAYFSSLLMLNKSLNKKM